MTTTERRPAGRRSTVRLALAGLAATALLAACGDDGADDEPTAGGAGVGVRDGGEPADPTSDVARPDATFRAEVTVAADAARVRWTFTNRAATEVLVANRLPDDSGKPDRTDIGYVTGDGKGVVVSQRVFAQPDTDRMDWAQAPKIGATRVAPGATIRGAVQVPRPFERLQPYGNDLGYGPIALPEPPAEIRFCLGVLPSPYPAPVADQKGVATPVLDHGLGNARAQYVFCSEPVPVPAAASS